MNSPHSLRKRVREQLASAGLRANKQLGQNFLVERDYLQRIAALAEDRPQDALLEIGAGLGALTEELAAPGQDLTAIEIDRGLFTLLQANLAGYQNLSLIHGDILETDLAALFPSQSYQVIANIPYYLTSKLIRHLLEAQRPPSRIHLLVQKEVAQRACQDAPNMNLLALSIQLFGSAQKLFAVPASTFFPAPKVDSAILRISPDADPQQATEATKVMRLARAAFQQKRKTLLNSLSALPDWDKDTVGQRLTEAGIDPQARPQHLSLDQWLKLSEALT